MSGGTPTRRLRIRLGISAVLLLCGLGAAGVLQSGWVHPADDVFPPRQTIDQPPTQHPVVIRQPAGSPGIPAGTFDEKGRPVTIACATCHSTKPVNTSAKLGTPLAQFHQGLIGKHGNLTCTSCHNQGDGYASLRLADGKSVPYTEVMSLCAQCHGPQYRDYQHGAHGGMTGHWDLTRGGRVRNNCIDCHDQHAPKYPTVSPARGPNDRFQTGGGHE